MLCMYDYHISVMRGKQEGNGETSNNSIIHGIISTVINHHYYHR